MKLAFFLLLLGFLELCCAKRPPKQGASNVRVRNQPTETEVYEETSLTLEIQHSIGRGSEFYNRGTLHLKNLKSSSGPLTFQQLPLPSSNFTSLRLAAKYGGHYFIRTRSKFTDLLSERGASEDTGDYVVTFISACALVNAKMSDLITINGDGLGNIIGLTLTVPMVTTDMDCENADEVGLPSQFNTTASLSNGIPAPVPDTQTFFQKIEREEMDKKEGKDNRSFLQKYWLYIIVGLVLFSFMNNAVGGGGGGG